jgi:hypothetical protein
VELYLYAFTCPHGTDKDIFVIKLHFIGRAEFITYEGVVPPCEYYKLAV